MRVCKQLFCLLVCLLGSGLVLSGTAAAQPGAYVQDAGNGALNWQNGVVTATGIGVAPPNAVNLAQARAMALRAATVTARKNLLEIIKGVQVDSRTLVEDNMLASDVTVQKVRGFLQNSQILDTAYMSDGSVEVTVGILMRGGFAGALIPPATQFGTRPGESAGPASSGQAAPGAQSGPELDLYSASGIVVDARGLGVRPALMPRIVDTNGREVYGPSFASRDYAMKHGMAGYAKDPEAARADERVAANPVMVQAQATTGRNRTDLVVPPAVADALLGDAGRSLLQECRVMVLLD